MRILKRITAWAVIACLVFSDAAFADISTLRAAITPEHQSRVQALTLKPDSLFVSPSAASISETYSGRDGKVLIHIQDAHTNLGAQKNLARVLDDIITQYGIDLVFVEGGTGNDSLSFLREYATPEVRKRTAMRFLEKGEISGEEYLDIVSSVDKPFLVWGVEDPDLYKDSLSAYSRIIDIRKAALKYIYRIIQGIDILKPKIYTREFHEFERAAIDFRNGKTPFIGYYELLLSEAEKNGIDISMLANLKRLAAVKRREADIDFAAAGVQQGEVARKLAATDSIFAEMLKEASKVRLSQPPTRGFYDAFRLRIDEAQISLDSYPELKKYLEYIGLFTAVDMKLLLQDVESIEESIFLSYSRDPDAARLREITKHLELLRNYFSLRLKPTEFAVYKKGVQGFDTSDWVAYLNRKLTEINRPSDIIAYDGILDERQEDVEAFYRTVEARDFAFVDRAFAKMEETKRSAAVLICGGYHTPHLKTLLEKQNTSYVIVTPFVTEETDMENYERVLLGSLDSTRRWAVSAKRGTIRPSAARERILVAIIQALFKAGSLFNIEQQAAALVSAEQMLVADAAARSALRRPTGSRTFVDKPTLVKWLRRSTLSELKEYLLAYDDKKILHFLELLKEIADDSIREAKRDISSYILSHETNMTLVFGMQQTLIQFIRDENILKTFERAPAETTVLISTAQDLAIRSLEELGVILEKDGVSQLLNSLSDAGVVKAKQDVFKLDAPDLDASVSFGLSPVFKGTEVFKRHMDVAFLNNFSKFITTHPALPGMREAAQFLGEVMSIERRLQDPVLRKTQHGNIVSRFAKLLGSENTADNRIAGAFFMKYIDDPLVAKIRSDRLISTLRRLQAAAKASPEALSEYDLNAGDILRALDVRSAYVSQAYLNWRTAQFPGQIVELDTLARALMNEIQVAPEDTANVLRLGINEMFYYLHSLLEAEIEDPIGLNDLKSADLLLELRAAFRPDLPLLTLEQAREDINRIVAEFRQSRTAGSRVLVDKETLKGWLQQPNAAKRIETYLESYDEEKIVGFLKLVTELAAASVREITENEDAVINSPTLATSIPFSGQEALIQIIQNEDILKKFERFDVETVARIEDVLKNTLRALNALGKVFQATALNLTANISPNTLEKAKESVLRPGVPNLDELIAWQLTYVFQSETVFKRHIDAAFLNEFAAMVSSTREPGIRRAAQFLGSALSLERRLPETVLSPDEHEKIVKLFFMLLVSNSVEDNGVAAAFFMKYMITDPQVSSPLLKALVHAYRRVYGPPQHPHPLNDATYGVIDDIAHAVETHSAFVSKDYLSRMLQNNSENLVDLDPLAYALIKALEVQPEVDSNAERLQINQSFYWMNNVVGSIIQSSFEEVDLMVVDLLIELRASFRPDLPVLSVEEASERLLQVIREFKNASGARVSLPDAKTLDAWLNRVQLIELKEYLAQEFTLDEALRFLEAVKPLLQRRLEYAQDPDWQIQEPNKYILGSLMQTAELWIRAFQPLTIQDKQIEISLDEISTLIAAIESAQVALHGGELINMLQRRAEPDVDMRIIRAKGAAFSQLERERNTAFDILELIQDPEVFRRHITSAFLNDLAEAILAKKYSDAAYPIRTLGLLADTAVLLGETGLDAKYIDAFRNLIGGPESKAGAEFFENFYELRPNERAEVIQRLKEAGADTGLASSTRLKSYMALTSHIPEVSPDEIKQSDFTDEITIEPVTPQSQAVLESLGLSVNGPQSEAARLHDKFASVMAYIFEPAQPDEFTLIQAAQVIRLFEAFAPEKKMDLEEALQLLSEWSQIASGSRVTKEQILGYFKDPQLKDLKALLAQTRTPSETLVLIQTLGEVMKEIAAYFYDEEAQLLEPKKYRIVAGDMISAFQDAFSSQSGDAIKVAYADLIVSAKEAEKARNRLIGRRDLDSFDLTFELEANLPRAVDLLFDDKIASDRKTARDVLLYLKSEYEFRKNVTSETLRRVGSYILSKRNLSDIDDLASFLGKAATISYYLEGEDVFEPVFLDAIQKLLSSSAPEELSLAMAFYDGYYERDVRRRDIVLAAFQKIVDMPELSPNQRISAEGALWLNSAHLDSAVLQAINIKLNRSPRPRINPQIQSILDSLGVDAGSEQAGRVLWNEALSLVLLSLEMTEPGDERYLLDIANVLLLYEMFSNKPLPTFDEVRDLLVEWSEAAGSRVTKEQLRLAGENIAAATEAERGGKAVYPIDQGGAKVSYYVNRIRQGRSRVGIYAKGRAQGFVTMAADQISARRAEMRDEAAMAKIKGAAAGDDQLAAQDIVREIKAPLRSLPKEISVPQTIVLYAEDFMQFLDPADPSSKQEFSDQAALAFASMLAAYRVTSGRKLDVQYVLVLDPAQMASIGIAGFDAEDALRRAADRVNQIRKPFLTLLDSLPQTPGRAVIKLRADSRNVSTDGSIYGGVVLQRGQIARWTRAVVSSISIASALGGYLGEKGIDFKQVSTNDLPAEAISMYPGTPEFKPTLEDILAAVSGRSGDIFDALRHLPVIAKIVDATLSIRRMAIQLLLRAA